MKECRRQNVIARKNDEAISVLWKRDSYGARDYFDHFCDLNVSMSAVRLLRKLRNLNDGWGGI